MAKVSPIQFFRQVKQEVKKVTWPTKKEVMQTSFMVIVIVAIAATCAVSTHRKGARA